MPKPHQPRHGSMQFWPRKRANKPYARVRSFAKTGEGLLAFAGYKMGMTQVKAFDSYKNSITKNESIALPVTILECPPVRIYSVRGYRKDTYGTKVVKETIVAGKDKHLARKVPHKKHAENPAALLDSFPADLDDVTVLVSTQPSMTGTGQKKPQIFEVGLGGKTPAEKIAAAKALVGRDIKASELFKEGEYADFHAVTTGRGFQGPIKRFGINLKPHKTEKGRRRPGNIGAWFGQQHTMYRVAFAGQMGFHQRVQYNNQILKITDKPEEVNLEGGFMHYGTGKPGNEFLVVKGSIPGPKKRMITILKPIRLKRSIPAPAIEEIALASQQGK